MNATLIIARHGNTFGANETPRRVGGRTDIPLTAFGRRQAIALGRRLKTMGISPDVVYCSNLKRTRETASLAIKAAGWIAPIKVDKRFKEIDYGVDENKTENEVIDRIGVSGIQNWDKHNIAPTGWMVDAKELKLMWINFAKTLKGTTLVITSNGIARFAPSIGQNAKLSTGAFGIICENNKKLQLKSWNIRPSVI